MLDIMNMGSDGSGIPYWNYSNPDKANYTTTIIGTIIRCQEIQAREWSPTGHGRPKFFENGGPKMNLRILLAQADGNIIAWTFPEYSQKKIREGKGGIHGQLINALTAAGCTTSLGTTIQISTQEGNWGLNNPRPFTIEVCNDRGPWEATVPIPKEFDIPKILCDETAHGGQVVQQQPPMYGQYYAPPQAPAQPQYQAPAYQAQPTYQPQPQMPPQQAYAPQVPQMPQMQQSAPMPQGMDPMLAQAVQSMGATNVQPVQAPQMPVQAYTPVNDPSMPF